MAENTGRSGRSIAREKRRNETKMIARQPVLLITIIVVIALLLLFVIYPLVKMLAFSFTDESGHASMSNLISILSTSRYMKTTGRTLLLGLVVALIATFIGYIFAYTTTRTNVPCKGFLKAIATLPKASAAQHLFLVAKTPAVVRRLVESGLPITQCNIGNMHFEEGKTIYKESHVYVDDNDLADIEYLKNRGLDVYIQILPTEKRIAL